MKIKKYLKYLILVPVMIFIAGILYLMLLLGEADEASQSQLLPKNVEKLPAIRPMNLQNASLDEILATFDAPMLVKSAMPEKLDLISKGGKHSSHYELHTIYRMESGQPYSIHAYKPLTALQKRNLTGMELKAEHAYSVAGLIAVWIEDKKGIYISASNENVSYFIQFPHLSESEIQQELNTLTLNR